MNTHDQNIEKALLLFLDQIESLSSRHDQRSAREMQIRIKRHKAYHNHFHQDPIHSDERLLKVLSDWLANIRRI